MAEQVGGSLPDIAAEKGLDLGPRDRLKPATPPWGRDQKEAPTAASLALQ